MLKSSFCLGPDGKTIILLPPQFLGFTQSKITKPLLESALSPLGYKATIAKGGKKMTLTPIPKPKQTEPATKQTAEPPQKVASPAADPKPSTDTPAWQQMISSHKQTTPAIEKAYSDVEAWLNGN